MRTECTFIMGPVDEAAFLKYVFEKTSAHIIPSVRNPTEQVPDSREISDLENNHNICVDEDCSMRIRIEYLAHFCKLSQMSMVW